MSLIFHADGRPKNAAAAAECRRWGVSTAQGLGRARRAAARASLSRSSAEEATHRALNLCGQNPNGTFADGNTCAAGGSGSSQDAFSVSDASRPPKAPGARGHEYDAAALAAAGDPADYEGAELVNGQVLWDRYAVPSDIHMKGAADASISDESAAVVSGGWSDEANARRREVAKSMPLRQQVAALVRDGAIAMGLSESEADERAAAFAEAKGRPPDYGYPEPHTLAWTARQFSSSIMNELMIEMSRARPRTPAQELEYVRLLSRMKNATPDEVVPTPADIAALVDAARSTPLKPGTTLWHGWEVKSFAEREKLDDLVASRAVFTNDTLLSTTTRPALAANFGKQDSFSGDLIKAKSGHYMTRDGAMATVIRIRGQKSGLPIGAVSHYPNEAEVTLAPSAFRFTGKTIVWMPMANDSGWPQDTFRTADQRWDEEGRVLFPVAVYDVEPAEVSP